MLRSKRHMIEWQVSAVELKARRQALSTLSPNDYDHSTLAFSEHYLSLELSPLGALASFAPMFTPVSLPLGSAAAGNHVTRHISGFW